MQETNDDMKKDGEPKNGIRSIAAKLAFFIALIVCGMIFFALDDYGAKYWMVRYEGILDDFFGENSWEVVDKEVNERYDSNNEEYDTYINWDVSVEDDGESCEYTISNYSYQMRKTLSFTAKRAFVQQLMFISHEKVGEEVKEEILSEYLTEDELEAVSVTISWRNGNPKPSLYTKLLKQDWFSYDATAEDWLKTGLYDYYLYIRAYDYKLTDEEKEHLLSIEDDIEQALQERYGEYADYEIYFPE